MINRPIDVTPDDQDSRHASGKPGENRNQWGGCLPLTGKLQYNPHVLADTTKHETGECRPQRLPVRNENVGGLFLCQAKNQELRPLVLKQLDFFNA